MVGEKFLVGHKLRFVPHTVGEDPKIKGKVVRVPIMLSQEEVNFLKFKHLDKKTKRTKEKISSSSKAFKKKVDKMVTKKINMIKKKHK